MPNQQPGESREDFIQRCIPMVIEDGTAQDGNQAYAICNSMYDQEEKAKFYRYTYNGVTCQATRRRSSDREDKAWVRTVKYNDNERLVHYADPNLPMRRNNEEARAAFNARHKCDTKKDPFAPGFWACYDWNNTDEKCIVILDDNGNPSEVIYGTQN